MGEIERFIATLPADWQRNLCDRLLAAQRRVDVGIAEAIKWRNTTSATTVARC